MYVYLPRREALVFAPTTELTKALLATATNLAELEDLERQIEAQRRSNLAHH
jgi:hypothetical protein